MFSKISFFKFYERLEERSAAQDIEILTKIAIYDGYCNYKLLYS